jgi:3'-5' exoribonuclease
MTIKEIKEGKNELQVLIKDIVEKPTRTGGVYLDILVGDGEKETWIKGFGLSKDTFESKPGDVVKIMVETTTYNGALSSKLINCICIPDADKSQYIESPPVSTEELFDECMAVVDEFTNIGLKTLVTDIYTENKEKLLYWGAAKTVHHNIYGGLLWHQGRMMRAAKALADVYPVDRELLIAGCLLHDIGKLKEMTTNEMGVSEYTVDGTLFGHLLMGVTMVRKYASKLHLEEELVRDLCPIIASHHGEKEYGAITTAATIDAYLVSEIDMMDSRLYVYEREENLLEPGTMTDRGTAVSGIIYRSANKI